MYYLTALPLHHTSDIISSALEINCVNQNLRFKTITVMF